MIVLDCAGVEMLSAYGVGQQSTFAETPNIDALDDLGVRFETAWALPTCSPTRASTLLGQFPFLHGIGRQISPGSTSLKAVEANTLPGILRDPMGLDLPYATGAYGKWHLSKNQGLMADDPASPQKLGFDRFEGEMFQVPGSYTDPFDLTSQWMKQVWDGSQVSQEGSDGVDYLISQQVQDAVDFFEARQTADGDQPVFIWLALQAPFENHQRPPATHSQNGLLFPGGTLPGNLAETGDEYLCYLETLHAADQEIGYLLSEIDRITDAPWYETTTVMLFGDNGSPGGVAQLPFSMDHAKDSLFEGGVRVPFYVSGRVVDQARRGMDEVAPVQVIDVYATCLEIAGLAAPGGHTVHSISLFPLVNAPSPTPTRTWLYSEKFATNFLGESPPYITGDRRIAKMLDVDGDWKLFHTPGGGSGPSPLDVLYDLNQTPWEDGDPVIPTPLTDPNFNLYKSKAATLRAAIQGLYGQ